MPRRAPSVVLRPALTLPYVQKDVADDSWFHRFFALFALLGDCGYTVLFEFFSIVSPFSRNDGDLFHWQFVIKTLNGYKPSNEKPTKSV